MATTFWECGFEGGDVDYYKAHGWLVGTSTIASAVNYVHKSLDGHSGTYSLFMNAEVYTPAFGAGGRWLHFWMRPANTTTQGTFYIQFWRNNGSSMSLTFSNNYVILRRGDISSTIVAFGPWNTAVPHWVSIEVYMKNAGGVFTLKADGVQVLTYSGDTCGVATEDWDQIRFSDINRYVDDIVITTDDELPEQFIPAIVPNADGSPLELTPSSGSNYQVAAQMPVAAETPYNQALATALEDNYAFTTISWTPDAIQTVGLWGYGVRDGAIVQGRLICNAVDGTAQNLPAAGYWGGISELWDGDPADSGNPWTKGKIDALTAGFEFI